MSPFIVSQGYGRSEIIENDTITRILTDQIYASEEVRLDRPATFDNSYEYVGLAQNGSSTSDAVWTIVRITWFAGRKVRVQFRQSTAWDTHVLGWA